MSKLTAEFTAESRETFVADVMRSSVYTGRLFPAEVRLKKSFASYIRKYRIHLAQDALNAYAACRRYRCGHVPLGAVGKDIKMGTGQAIRKSNLSGSQRTHLVYQPQR